MSYGKTDAEAQNSLNTMRGTNHVAWTPFLGLLVASPAGDGTGITEASYVGYARVAIVFDAPVDDVYGLGTSHVEDVVAFAVAVPALQAVLGIGIFDAVSGGNLRRFGVANFTVPNGQTPRVTVRVVED